MGAMLPSRIWTQQPQQGVSLDAGNPLCAGLTAWLPSNPFQLFGKVNARSTSEGSYNSSPVAKPGVGRKWTRAASAGIDFGVKQVITQNAGVTVLVFAAPVAGTSLKVPFSQRAAGGAFTQTDFVFNSKDLNAVAAATSGALMLSTYHSAGLGVAADSQVDGNPHCWVVSNSTSSGYIVRDGVAQTLASSLRSTTLTASTQRVRIGNIADDTSATYPCDDPIYLVAVWDRQLSLNEAISVSRDPWQIFAPIRRNVFASLAGGATNATGSGSFASVTIAAPSGSGAGSASASSELASISLSAPTGSASAGVSAFASGSLAAVSVSAPSASATASAAASGSFATIALTAPTGSAAGTTAGGASAFGSLSSISISAASAVAIGSAMASGGFQSIGITAPNGSASTSSGNATASGALASVSIVAPTGYASSGLIRAPSGSGPSIIQPGSIRPSQSATSRIGNSSTSRPSNTGGRR